jgi:DNA-binding MarR family transcriptional regulator
MSHVEEAPPTVDALRQAGTLVLLVRAVDQQLKLAMTPEVLSLAELGVLGQVARGVDLPSQVARALRLDRARVTHLVDRLVEREALTRSLDPNDRRCWRLGLTERGLQLLEEGRVKARAAMEGLLEGLTGEERAGLSLGLAGARRVLEAQRNPAAES